MQIQKINSVNNLNSPNQSFKGAYRVTMPKTAFYDTETEELAIFAFNLSLTKAIKSIPRNFIEKIVYVLGLKPEALDFFKYPGYEHFNVARGDKSMSWFNQHMQARYGIDFNLPEDEKDYYKFFLLTKKELDDFLKAEKGVPKRVRNSIFDLLDIQQMRGIMTEQSEIAVLNRAITGSITNNVFGTVCDANNGIEDVHYENLSELSAGLKSLVNR